VSLIIDNRVQLANEGKAGLHALIVGVSTYRHLPGGGGKPAEESLGLQQLVGTSRSAHKMAQWLITADSRGLLPQPLATVRLLISPSATKEPQLAGLADPATWANFEAEAKAWRDDASTGKDNITFFYFAGHGVERRKADAVLLLADYGDPDAGAILNNAVDAAHLLAGMAPPADATKQMARTQFYFFDACRTFANEFTQYEWEEIRKIWSIKIGGVDDRTAAAFFGSVPGDSAYTQEDQTIFSLALLNCLDRTAAIGPEVSIPRWRVTTTSLIDALPDTLALINEARGTTQGFAPGGIPKKATIVYLAAPPEIDVEMSVEPPTRVANFGFEIRSRNDVTLKKVVPITPHPFKWKLPAGLYRLIAFPDPPHPTLAPVSEIVPVTLPECPPWVARVDQP
jgi:hypothetical protein